VEINTKIIGNVLLITFEFDDYRKPLIEEIIVGEYEKDTSNTPNYIYDKSEQVGETMYSDEVIIELMSDEIDLVQLKSKIDKIVNFDYLEIEDTLSPRTHRDLFVSTHEKFKTMIRIRANMLSYLDNIIPRGKEFIFEKVRKEIPYIGVRTVITVNVITEENVSNFRLFGFDPLFVKLLEDELNRTKLGEE